MAASSLADVALDHGDRGTHINASLWALMSISSAFLLLRLYCRHFGRQKLWWDDYVLLVSWVLFLVSIVISTVNVAYGLGKHIYFIDLENIFDIYFLFYPTEFFITLAGVLSKTSFALALQRRLQGPSKAIIWLIIVSTHIVLDLSAIFLWTQCTPVQRTWDSRVSGTCWKPEVYFDYKMFATLFSAFTDLMLTFLPLFTLSIVQLNWAEKAGIAVAMAVGLLAGGSAIAKAVLSTTLRYSTDFTYDVDQVTIWNSAEVAMTIVAVSIPTFRVLCNRKQSSRKDVAERLSADGIEVSNDQRQGAWGGRRNLNEAAADITRPNEIDSVDMVRAQPPVELGNSQYGPVNATEMNHDRQPQFPVPELLGCSVIAPTELPGEGVPAVWSQQPELARQQVPPPTLPPPTSDPDVVELLRLQAQLQEKKRRLQELQEIEEQEEAIRRQLLRAQSGQSST